MKTNNHKKKSIYLKYSKSSDFYISTKKNFFSQNANLLSRTLKQNELYKKQPRRMLCKICGSKLQGNIDFQSHNIEYIFCNECTHLNGIYEDTKEFVETVYLDDDGSDYSQNYIDVDFTRRSKDIYSPKIDFLSESLIEEKIDILDIGCGMGYLVHAGLAKNLEIKGVDVNRAMIDAGNNQIEKSLDKRPLKFVKEEAFYDLIIDTNSPIISAIGVIEHLREPHKFFDAFKKSNAKYLYYSVPMFSFTVIMQTIFQDIFPRHLPGEHTHLYTEKSLKKMHEILESEVVSQWRFGVDAMDLYRSAKIKLEENNVSSKITDYFEKGFGKKIDEFQNIFDKNHFCSEIHCVLKKISN